MTWRPITCPLPVVAVAKERGGDRLVFLHLVGAGQEDAVGTGVGGGDTLFRSQLRTEDATRRGGPRAYRRTRGGDGEPLLGAGDVDQGLDIVGIAGKGGAVIGKRAGDLAQFFTQNGAKVVIARRLVISRKRTIRGLPRCHDAPALHQRLRLKIGHTRILGEHFFQPLELGGDVTPADTGTREPPSLRRIHLLVQGSLHVGWSTHVGEVELPVVAAGLEDLGDDLRVALGRAGRRTAALHRAIGR